MAEPRPRRGLGEDSIYFDALIGLIGPQPDGRLGHRRPDPPAGGPAGGHAVDPPVAPRACPAFGQSPAEAYLTSERESHNLTEDALRSWRPPQTQRGRRPRS